MSDTTYRPERSDELADRYMEIRGFRSEALAKYGASEISVIAGPPVRLSLPAVGFDRPGNAKKRIGPFRFYDRPPVIRFVEALLRKRNGVRVLEIGPGGGELAHELRLRFGSKIEAYYGLDRDRAVTGDFASVGSIDELPTGIDIVIAGEVIEHMSADELFRTILRPLRCKLNAGAAFILSTPNPTSPGGVARDFTHVQRYPWYDLYAIFRLAFENVEIYRSFYLYEPKRLLLLIPRILLCSILELEWCDGLVCVATGPRDV
jgi:SAM-dependent methyltransferase